MTIAGVPADDRRLLITSPSGFPIDVTLLAPERVRAASVLVSCIPWSGAERVDLRHPIRRSADGATFVVPPEAALPPGSYTLLATVERPGGGSESIAFEIAVRTPQGPAPLAVPQWVQLDFAVDRDGDGLPDFAGDLAAFGLASGVSASVDRRVADWVIQEIVARAQAFYDAPHPSGLQEQGPASVQFSATAPEVGPYTRICAAGENPDTLHEGSIIGNVRLDPGNRDPADVACDNDLPSGVFPREIRYYQNEAAYQDVFGALIAQPAGSDPLDRIVLASHYDPTDPAQRERFEVLRRGIQTFAQVVASVAAHEAGHAMGLVPPGAPGRGLFGGEVGAQFTHNETPDGEVPEANLLMNAGPTLTFEDLAGTGASGPPRIRALNYAYLHGWLLLDAAVDGVYMPPSISRLEPDVVDIGGPPVAVLELTGRDFASPPRLVLRGLADYSLGQAGVLPGRDGAPDTLVATLLVPNMLPGAYDVELTNPDGQTTTLPGALEVR